MIDHKYVTLLIEFYKRTKYSYPNFIPNETVDSSLGFEEWNKLFLQQDTENSLRIIRELINFVKNPNYNPSKTKNSRQSLSMFSTEEGPIKGAFIGYLYSNPLKVEHPYTWSGEVLKWIEGLEIWVKEKETANQISLDSQSLAKTNDKTAGNEKEEESKDNFDWISTPWLKEVMIFYRDNLDFFKAQFDNPTEFQSWFKRQKDEQLAGFFGGTTIILTKLMLKKYMTPDGNSMPLSSREALAIDVYKDALKNFDKNPQQLANLLSEEVELSSRDQYSLLNLAGVDFKQRASLGNYIDQLMTSIHDKKDKPQEKVLQGIIEAWRKGTQFLDNINHYYREEVSNSYTISVDNLFIAERVKNELTKKLQVQLKEIPLSSPEYHVLIQKQLTNFNYLTYQLARAYSNAPFISRELFTDLFKVDLTAEDYISLVDKVITTHSNLLNDTTQVTVKKEPENPRAFRRTKTVNITQLLQANAEQPSPSKDHYKEVPKADSSIVIQPQAVEENVISLPEVEASAHNQIASNEDIYDKIPAKKTEKKPKIHYFKTPTEAVPMFYESKNSSFHYVQSILLPLINNNKKKISDQDAVKVLDNLITQLKQLNSAHDSVKNETDKKEGHYDLSKDTGYDFFVHRFLSATIEQVLVKKNELNKNSFQKLIKYLNKYAIALSKLDGSDTTLQQTLLKNLTECMEREPSNEKSLRIFVYMQSLRERPNYVFEDPAWLSAIRDELIDLQKTSETHSRFFGKNSVTKEVIQGCIKRVEKEIYSSSDKHDVEQRKNEFLQNLYNKLMSYFIPLQKSSDEMLLEVQNKIVPAKEIRKLNIERKVALAENFAFNSIIDLIEQVTRPDIDHNNLMDFRKELVSLEKRIQLDNKKNASDIQNAFKNAYDDIDNAIMEYVAFDLAYHKHILFPQ